MTSHNSGGNRKHVLSAFFTMPRRCAYRCRQLAFISLLLAAACLSPPGSAQVSFQQAIHLAATNSPRVQTARTDLLKAQAGLRVLKDIYIPSVMLGGGIGDSYGIMLTVPTIFTINAQSLVYSSQQRSYIRAARSDLQAAQLALQDARQQVEEDAAITYLSIDRAQQSMQALAEQNQQAQKLVSIVEDRVNAHLDSQLELEKTRRGAMQIQLQKLQARDDLEDLQAHLAQLTGLDPPHLQILPDSIPMIAPGSAIFTSSPPPNETPGLRAAEDNAKAKQQRARGDAHYTWRPIVNLGASYGRVSPIENVQKFYNLNGIYNVASFGVGIQFPILDRVRRQAARQSQLDAQSAQLDLENLRSDEFAGRHKLQRSIPELRLKAEMAELDDKIARDELAGAEEQSHHATGGPVMTPKELANARIQERQKFLDMLDARFQEHKAEISFLRLTGQLDTWVQRLVQPTKSLEQDLPILPHPE